MHVKTAFRAVPVVLALALAGGHFYPTAILDGRGAGSTLTIKPSGKKVSLVDLVVTGIERRGSL
jgi:hypothetical protein